MALRCSLPTLRASTVGKFKQVCLVVVATSVSSGMRPPAVIARNTNAELEKQLAKETQLRVEAEERANKAEKRAKKEAEWARQRSIAGCLLACAMALILRRLWFGPGAISSYATAFVDGVNGVKQLLPRP
ncbi:hypothetical protein HYH03_002441 [Edaphochlamys debaryana]|uniref:Uncharacterized protein n=1 Tax=Edaphochlamys debaryana TaxID=47281 RepID=A0A836C561_9CHLO|nr:hypothetical protein HYH03_002441 [Edaphochlamys debaryana]|eukprot:KAG2499494.1 hypothetical protein HYH03_002441 [Edaphochlamys debaryana]